MGCGDGGVWWGAGYNWMEKFQDSLGMPVFEANGLDTSSLLNEAEQAVAHVPDPDANPNGAGSSSCAVKEEACSAAGEELA